MNDSTAASSAVAEHKEVENFTYEERETWLKTGEMPPKDKPVEDASATSKPAGEAGKEGESGTPKKDKSDPDKNWKALREKAEAAEARAAKVEKELDELRKQGSKPADAKPAAEPPKAPEPPKRPRMAEFLNKDGTLDGEKYEAAMDKYEKDREEFRELSERQKNAKVEQERVLGQWKSELTTKYGDEAGKVDLKAIVDGKLLPLAKDAPAIFAMLNSSEVFTDVLYVLSTDPKLDEFIELAKTNPAKAIRKLVLIEEGVEKELAAKKNGAGKTEEKPEGKTETKKITGAGKPPAEVGGTNSATVDEAEAALKRGDGDEYRRIMNQRDAEKRRGRRGR